MPTNRQELEALAFDNRTASVWSIRRVEPSDLSRLPYRVGYFDADYPDGMAIFDTLTVDEAKICVSQETGDRALEWWDRPPSV